MSLDTLTPNYAAIKARQQQTWASGDYHVIAAIIMPISERLCDTVDLRANQRVLDIATGSGNTGSGNTAIAAARRLSTVTGLDYAPTLLERARARAAAEGFNIAFEEGDSERLPAESGAYDVVLSTLGVMFSPNQSQAASELLRVTRPGGTIGLANWTPEGWIGAMLRTVGRHVPPPAGLQPVTRWGTEAGIRELLGEGTTSIETNRVDFVWRFASAEQYLDLFRRFYGPTVKAFEALDDAGQQALADDLLETLAKYAESADGTLKVPAEYLEVVAIRR